MVTLVRPMHLVKAKHSIVVTPLPMVTLIRFEQPRNTSSPIAITLSGMVIDVRLEQ